MQIFYNFERYFKKTITNLENDTRMFNLNFFPISHYQPFKKIRALFYIYRFLSLLIYLLYVLVYYKDSTIGFYLLLSLGSLLILFVLNYLIERKTAQLLLKNTQKDALQGRFHLLNCFIGWSLPFDAFIALTLLIDSFHRHAYDDYLVIYATFLCFLAFVHAFYFPTYKTGLSWKDNYSFRYIAVGGATGILATVIIVVLYLLINKQYNEPLWIHIKQDALSLSILLLLSMIVPLVLRLLLRSELRRIAEKRDKVLGVTNKINEAIGKLEKKDKNLPNTEGVNNRVTSAAMHEEDDIDAIIKTNELAKLIGESLEVEFFSIGLK